MPASLLLARYSPRAAGRMLRSMRRNLAALRASPGLETARLLMLAELDTARGGTLKPTSYGLLCGWRNETARDEFLSDGTHLSPMLEGAAEAWNLSLDTVRAVRGDWWGWRPRSDGVARLGPEEPVLVMTYGLVRWRHMPIFTWRNRQIVRHVARDPGMTLRIGFFDTAKARGTLSLWRSQREMLSFAYRSAPHDPVQREAIRVPWADGFFFARFRPVASAGSWDGRDPLAELRRESERAADSAGDPERGADSAGDPERGAGHLASSHVPATSE